jgi:hypothetical protein
MNQEWSMEKIRRALRRAIAAVISFAVAGLPAFALAAGPELAGTSWQLLAI